MEIIKIPVGMYQVNCYIVRDTNSVVVIDPGAKAERIISYLKETDHVLGILLTHGHFDHIGAVHDIVSQYACPIYAHPDELEILNDPEKNYSLTKKIKLTLPIQSILDLDTLGPFSFKIHETPGHTQGSVLIQVGEHLFTGDTLFRLGEGRTDLFSGNSQQMKKSLAYIRTLDHHLIVHPGHEEDTQLGIEFSESPSFNR